MDTGLHHTRQIKKQIYIKPLIVYKLKSDAALSATLKIIEYFLKIDTTEEIYVEDILLIKSCFDCPENWELESRSPTCKNLWKLNQLNIKEHKVDLCIVVGGDGTIVWANSIFESKERPPFLTFNLGTLGYMAIYFFQNYEKVLNDIFNIDTKLYVEKRSFLKGRILNQDNKPKKSISYSLEFMKNRKSSSDLENNLMKNFNIIENDVFALNEITIERKANNNMIKTEIYYNEEALTTIRSNGIILASPTGSTAYSLSAAGTIVHYGVDCFILNSICPHSLSFRPIAFPRGDKLKVLLTQDSQDAVVIKDGIFVTNLKPHQAIEIEMSDMYVEFLLTEDSYEKKSTMWKQKIIDQLGWNNAFKNFEIDLNGDKYVEK